MDHFPALPQMQCALRAAICTRCWRRPKGSESQPPTSARACEIDCAIFANLPHLREIWARATGGALSPYQDVLRELICVQCRSTMVSQDVCDEKLATACPLARYLGEIVGTLDELAHAQPV